ncbi:MAG: hypothetical protein VKK80_11375 [Prochlorothrix sp.]|nr:hypothetical protein [Prochlorothrix sp.]
MVTQTFSQYLSPSWQLTLQSQPSPLSHWMGEVVVRQLQFQLIRLLSPSPAAEAVSAPDPSGDRSLGQSIPPFPSPLRSSLPSPDVVLEGNEQLLQHLYAALQSYVEQHLGCGLGNPSEAVLAWSGLIPVPPLPPQDRASAREERSWLDRQERSGESGLAASSEAEPWSDGEETAGSNPALAVLPIETAIGPDLHQPLSLDLDAETLAELETVPGFDNYLESPSSGQAQPQQPLCIQIEPCSALRHRLSYFPTWLRDVSPPYPDGFAPLDPGLNPELAPPSTPDPETSPQPALILEVTTLELFDLLDVLDQWHSSMVFLPDLRAPNRSSAQPWLKSAALVLITVGVTVGGMQIFQGRDRVALSPSTETAPSAASDLPSLGNLALGGDPGTNLEAQLNLGQAPPSPDTLGLPQVPGAPGATGAMPGSVPLGASQPLSQSGAVTLPPPPLPGWLTLPPPPSTSAGPLAPLPIAPQVPLSPTESGRSGTGRSTAPSAASGDMAIADAAPPAPPNAESLARLAPEAASASAESAQAAIDPAITSSQVAAVRSYFQSVWQAPAALTQPLQYGLVIGPNGALQTISPQDTSAGNFLDRTGMPLLGEPFVPAAADGYNRSMNLTLYPDGGVEVYSLGAW